MEWEIYELTKSADGLRYSFYSVGPRGQIGKVLRFQWVPGLGNSTFNLAFGDYKDTPDQLDDKSITNNNDRLKVLHTVATAAMDFLENRPMAIILIVANSSARARLYQMMISSIGRIIEREYEIQGKHGHYWIPFVKGLNYSKFIVYKKIQ